MSTINITKANALKAIDMADESLKPLLQELLGVKPEPKNIMERVKTVEDAIAIVGISDDLRALLSIKTEDTSVIAAQNWCKASIICKALNEGWVPDWSDSSQYKYYPWFDMRSGSGLSCDGYGDVYSRSGVGSRLVFKSSELAKYTGTQFLDVYSQFMTFN